MKTIRKTSYFAAGMGSALNLFPAAGTRDYRILIKKSDTDHLAADLARVGNNLLTACKRCNNKLGLANGPRK